MLWAYGNMQVIMYIYTKLTCKGMTMMNIFLSLSERICLTNAQPAPIKTMVINNRAPFILKQNATYENENHTYNLRLELNTDIQIYLHEVVCICKFDTMIKLGIIILMRILHWRSIMPKILTICIFWKVQIDGLMQWLQASIAKATWVHSLWPSDTIWRHRIGSTLAQVMVCCLMAPSHYLNQCWLIILKVQVQDNHLRAISQEIDKTSLKLLIYNWILISQGPMHPLTNVWCSTIWRRLPRVSPPSEWNRSWPETTKTVHIVTDKYLLQHHINLMMGFCKLALAVST